ncbi:MAG: hypothetical protein U1E17_07095 [Geminicoccaceae bacterium]
MIAGFVIPPRVVILGGGFTGAAVGVHLARGSAVPLTVQIVEPRPGLGAGHVAAQLEAARAQGQAMITHVRDHAVAVERRDPLWRVRLASGRILLADLVVLAADGLPSAVSAQLATADRPGLPQLMENAAAVARAALAGLGLAQATPVPVCAKAYSAHQVA